MRWSLMNLYRWSPTTWNSSLVKSSFMLPRLTLRPPLQAIDLATLIVKVSTMLKWVETEWCESGMDDRATPCGIVQLQNSTTFMGFALCSMITLPDRHEGDDTARIARNVLSNELKQTKRCVLRFPHVLQILQLGSANSMSCSPRWKQIRTNEQQGQIEHRSRVGLQFAKG